jgi:hypothetical protein
MGYKPRPSRAAFMVSFLPRVFPRQMIVVEFKAKGKTTQYSAIDEAIRTAQFVRNKCVRFWMDNLGRITVAVNPAYTSQDCSSCGITVKKSLSNRTHVCKCGCLLDRDHNAAINILNLGLGTTGHVGTWIASDPNASGDLASTVLGANLFQQAGSMNEESPPYKCGECQKSATTATHDAYVVQQQLPA